MYPPSWVCKEIVKLDAPLRLAWYGFDAPTKGELNCGWFALVRLCHISEVGTVEDPFTSREFWDVDMVMDENGKMSWQNMRRGPLYNKNGGSTRDYDPIFIRPVLFQVLNERWGFNGTEVYTGEILPFIRKQIMDAKELKRRRREQVINEARDKQRKIRGLSEQMVDRWFFEANKTGETADTSIPLKDSKQALKHQRGLHKLWNGELELEDMMLKRKCLT